MFNSYKKIILGGTLIAFFTASFLFGFNSESKVQSYYDGDVLVYNNQLIIISTNSGRLEIFRLSGSKLIKISATDPITADAPFTDGILSIENDRLYAYTLNSEYILSSKYLSKYDISDLSHPKLIKKVKNTNWDHVFMSLRKTDNHIVTIGQKNIQLWNYDLQAVNGYKNPDKNDRIYISSDGNWLFDIEADYITNYQKDKENDFIRIINTQTRQVIMEQQIVLNEVGRHNVYFDINRNLAYIAGDRVLKQINVLTKEIKNFKHTSTLGYDADGSGKDYFYFSDGIGIVKMDHNLEPLDWVHNQSFNIPNSWAMGLKVVEQGGRDRIVVFNNSNIVVLDENLDELDHWESTEEAKEVAREKLSLSVDRNRAPQNSQISLRGAGFVPNEELTIRFGKLKIDMWSKLVKGLELSRATIVADANGRFQKVLTVPELPKNIEVPLAVDIIVEGVNSGLRYNMSFMIE